MKKKKTRKYQKDKKHDILRILNPTSEVYLIRYSRSHLERSIGVLKRKWL